MLADQKSKTNMYTQLLTEGRELIFYLDSGAPEHMSGKEDVFALELNGGECRPVADDRLPFYTRK